MKKTNWGLWGTIAVVVIIIGGGLWWIISAGNGPQPGTVTKDDGRTHVTDIGGIHYDSNPPSSGSHFPVWAKRGVYPQIISDGYLIHSQEHGYIIFWYNCGPLGKPTNGITHKKGDPLTKLTVANQINVQPITPQTMPPAEVPLPADFSTPQCQSMVKQLASFLNDYQRIIVAPRPDMDSKIILSAWDHLEKFNGFDEAKMQEFVAAYHNRGPEQTIE